MKPAAKKINLQVPLRYVKQNTKLLAALLLCFVLFFYVWPLTTTSLDVSWMWPRREIVHNVLEPGYEPKTDGKSIFFVETNKVADNVIHLNSRQSCSIEAAALSNPDHEIFVLFSYEVDFPQENPSPLIEALRTYSNVHFRYFNIIDFAVNTPLELWFREGEILKSEHIIEHESDILRILALWKYGGSYFDLDVIVKKPVSSIGPNFACWETGGLINSAVVNLDGDIGRKIAERNFDVVSKHFDAHSWSGNGPQILSNIVKEICNTTTQWEMTREKCSGFKVLPTEDCYAIHYPSWGLFFDENEAERVEKATKDSFAVHFWNKLSHGANLSTHSGAAYIKIAEQHCPKVLHASGDSF